MVLIADISVILCQILVRLYVITVTRLGRKHWEMLQYTDTVSVTVTAEPQIDGRLLGLALGVDSPRAKPHCPQAWALARAEQPTQGQGSDSGSLGRKTRAYFV